MSDPVYLPSSDPVETFGVSKRELFAAIAMHALSANTDFSRIKTPQIAEWSVEQADELIAALNKPTK